MSTTSVACLGLECPDAEGATDAIDTLLNYQTYALDEKGNLCAYSTFIDTRKAATDLRSCIRYSFLQCA